ncbi:hypothetical protein BTR23_24080 [Alkalihalophilus pseudofirmus]|nr:hypothetical protein BTR23_24080 [Alkalihalophilus pseudofirmus]
MSPILSENFENLNRLFSGNSDITFRNFTIGKNMEVSAFIIGIEGLFDKSIISNNVIKPLMECMNDECSNLNHKIELEIQSVVSVSSIHIETEMQVAIQKLMKGDPLLFINGINKAYIIGARAWETRSIEEPVTETTVRGPREAFSETLGINTALLRRKIHHPNLMIEPMTLGTYSQTDIAIAFIDEIASKEIVSELLTRLKRIDVDAILDSGYIEELIEDNPYSIFPDIKHTERPDTVAARLLEGRVAIMVEGTPTALIVPFLFMEAFQSVDDYYSRSYYSSLMRVFRIFSFIIATLLPATYVAAQNYHKEMFPTDFLISVAAAREGVPFPLFIEVLLMVIAFEMLKESGIRMPTPVGQAVAIVGGLVLGEAAVQAGIVGTITVIVIATTAIATFLTPNLNDAVGILRIVYLISAGLLGVFGITLVVSFVLIHLVSMRSFSIPYMSPLTPITWSGWRDLFIRFPHWAFNQRPAFIPNENQKRQGDNQKPSPPSKGD